MDLLNIQEQNIGTTCSQLENYVIKLNNDSNALASVAGEEEDNLVFMAEVVDDLYGVVIQPNLKIDSAQRTSLEMI